MEQNNSRATSSISRPSQERPTRHAGTRPSNASIGAGRTERPQRQERPDRSRPQKTKRKSKKFPLWAKALIITGLLFVSLIFGMMIGYSFIGNGPIGDVFSFSTWKHILELIIG